MADELFAQADLNQDQRLDLNEFRNLLVQNLGNEATNFAANATGGVQYTGSSYESSSSATYGNVGGANANYSGVADLTGGTINAAGAAGGGVNYNSYEQSSYTSAYGVNNGSLDVNASLGFGIDGFGTSTASGVDVASEAAGVSLSSTFETTSSQQQVYLDANNPKNLYQDPNPQIIRRAAQNGQVTYTQNVKVRFLQPPPVPPPGPLIIKEVRPPQPPPLPPLRICQQAPPRPQPPPLVLRERPPVPPAYIAPQTVIRRLAALPVPPRSVIVERLPPLPPKPRDIIIERWIPYAVAAKRRTIIQRAGPAQQYPKPRNIIIQYEPVQVRVIRRFQRLGIVQENPQLYIQRYGASLLDAPALLQQARAAGVIEDISPPNNISTTAANLTSFNAEFNSASSGIETAGGVGLTTVVNAGAGASSFESSIYSGGQQGNASFSGFEAAQGPNLGVDFSASYESSSLSAQGGDTAFGGAASGSASASGYENSSAPAAGVNSQATDPVTAAFHAADLNKDGALDANEFRQFVISKFQYRQ